MNRKIKWESHEFDAIELVYEKAAANDSIEKMLEQLETAALSEAKNNCELLTTNSGKHIFPEQFDGLSEIDKETVIKELSEIGLGSISRDIQTATIFIRFTPKIQSVLACTIFNVLNLLEKLDGVTNINIMKPKWTLELQVPVGGNKGLLQWKMLIALLYPWIPVRETTTDQAADTLIAMVSGVLREPPKAPQETPQKGPEKGMNSEAFFAAMNQYPAFLTVFDRAKTEFGEAFQKEWFSLNYPLTYDQWRDLPETYKLFFVLELGNHGISVRACICVDFAGIIPNCIALMLLYSAWSGQGDKQLIDAGDDEDVKKFVGALSLLHSCYEKWECTICNPVQIEIGKSPVAKENKAETKREKKSFLKKLFGK